MTAIIGPVRDRQIDAHPLHQSTGRSDRGARILFRGQDLARPPWPRPARRPRPAVSAWSSQEYNLVERLSVIEKRAVRTVGLRRGMGGHGLRRFPAADVDRGVPFLLDAVGFDRFRDATGPTSFPAASASASALPRGLDAGARPRARPTSRRPRSTPKTSVEIMELIGAAAPGERDISGDRQHPTMSTSPGASADRIVGDVEGRESCSIGPPQAPRGSPFDADLRRRGAGWNDVTSCHLRPHPRAFAFPRRAGRPESPSSRSAPHTSSTPASNPRQSRGNAFLAGFGHGSRFILADVFRPNVAHDKAGIALWAA